MRLPFLNRAEEVARLRKFMTRKESSLAVLYGRRRCGKSRLLQEVFPSAVSVYYVADDREGPLQRASMAAEIGRKLPGFDRVTYLDWDALFARWWDEAAPGSALVLDEFSALASQAREVPSVLQKHVDRQSPRGPHLVLAGSSQRMMQGLVLSRSAPLFGRAVEILKIGALTCGWIKEALRLADARQSVESYSVWGGVPRYWELAADFDSRDEAVKSLVLSPLGVLYDEPAAILLDDSREVAQAASILTLIGGGSHRLSEIAARLEKPATSLSRPLQRLLDLDIIRRDVPFGTSLRDSKRTLYRIADPFLRFWFRFVEPNRSRLGSSEESAVAREISARFGQHVSGVWEDLVRQSIPCVPYFGREWKAATSWWGTGLDRRALELDLVAESTDGKSLLIGEVKWTTGHDLDRLKTALSHRSVNFPLTRGRQVLLGVWLNSVSPRSRRTPGLFTPDQVVESLM